MNNFPLVLQVSPDMTVTLREDMSADLIVQAAIANNLFNIERALVNLAAQTVPAQPSEK